jgi:3-oxoacyl-(acyl-carrier-protein) synthase
MGSSVVVTGMGVVAPNGHGVAAFEQALRDGVSGIRADEEAKRLRLRCQISGCPPDLEELRQSYFSTDPYAKIMGSNTIAATVAAADCWTDAGFVVPPRDGTTVDWETSAIIGTEAGNPERVFGWAAAEVLAGRTHNLGSSLAGEAANSAVSQRVGARLGLGGKVSTLSSACASGTEAILEGYYLVSGGRAKRVLAGASSPASPFMWAALDAIRVLAAKYNDTPERASRPLSASSAGLVPAGGAAILLLEEESAALSRGARIYAEVVGGHLNCGGQRNGGSQTAANPEGFERCVRAAMASTGTAPEAISLISGHLTGTKGDIVELQCLSRALGLPPERFPLINATKSLTGHAIAASGAFETVAAVLELYRGFVHPSVNCEDLRPELEAFRHCIPMQAREAPLDVVFKSSLGFGDVNACLVLRRWRAKGETHAA